MAEMKAVGVNLIAGLIDIVTRYIDKLPQEMRDELEQLCEQGAYDIGADHIERLGLDYSAAAVFADGSKIDRVVSLNPIRREYAIYVDDSIGLIRVKAETARLVVGDYVVCEW